MLSWWKGLLGPRARSCRGPSLDVVSGELLVVDPNFASETLRIGPVPLGRLATRIEARWSRRGVTCIERLSVPFSNEPPDERRELGRVAVETASLMVIDARTHERHWRDVGPERIGYATSTASLPSETVARAIENRFGMKWRPDGPRKCMFVDPVSPEREREIEAFLPTLPGCSDYAFFHFQIRTRNTEDLIMEKRSASPAFELVLDESSGANLIVVATGDGDGEYPAVGLFRAGRLVGFEVVFVESES